MTMLWEAYAPTAAENTADPPIGAPERATRLKNVNDIERRMMAAIREIGDWLTLVAGGQNISAQDLYDMYWPIGSERIYLSGAASTNFNIGATPEDPVYARWQQVTGLGGAYFIGNGTFAPLGEVTSGSNNLTINAGGDHNHGGNTAGHALTTNQLPAHNHGLNIYQNANPNGDQIASAAGSGTPSSRTTNNTGGGQAHSHGIAASGTHTHTGTISPQRVGIAIARRIE